MIGSIGTMGMIPGDSPRLHEKMPARSAGRRFGGAIISLIIPFALQAYTWASSTIWRAILVTPPPFDHSGRLSLGGPLAGLRIR